VISSSQRTLPTQQTDIYAVSEIRTRDPSHQVVAQPPGSARNSTESSDLRASRWAGHVALIAKRTPYRTVEGKYETKIKWNTSAKCYNNIRMYRKCSGKSWSGFLRLETGKSNFGFHKSWCISCLAEQLLSSQ
jgi:hypothetical protein